MDLRHHDGDPVHVERGLPRWHVLGDGFDEHTTLEVDGQPCEILDREGPTALWAKSPPLTVGTHDATVTTKAGSFTRPNAVNAFDPRTGYSGTWGGAIRGCWERPPRSGSESWWPL